MKIFDPAVNILKKNVNLKHIKHIKYYSLSGKAFSEKFKSKKNKFNFSDGINKKIKNKKKYLKIYLYTFSCNKFIKLFNW
jgi:hypothetical protein